MAGNSSPLLPSQPQAATFEGSGRRIAGLNFNAPTAVVAEAAMAEEAEAAPVVLELESGGGAKLRQATSTPWSWVPRGAKKSTSTIERVGNSRLLEVSTTEHVRRDMQWIQDVHVRMRQMRLRDLHNRRFAFAVAAERWHAVRLIQRHVLGWLERTGRLDGARRVSDPGVMQAHLRAYAERIYLGQDDTGGTAAMTMMALMDPEAINDSGSHGVATGAPTISQEPTKRVGGGGKNGRETSGQTAGGASGVEASEAAASVRERCSSGRVRSRKASGDGGFVRLNASARGSRARTKPCSGPGPSRGSADENVPPLSSDGGGGGGSERLGSPPDSTPGPPLHLLYPLNLTDGTPLGPKLEPNAIGKDCHFQFSIASRREKEFFFAIHPECHFIRACEARLMPLPSDLLSHPERLPQEGVVLHSAYLARFNTDIRYMHMVTVDVLPQSKNLVAVWQAAPSPGNYTKMRLGVEGLEEQRIFISLSKDPEGRRWTQPQVVPLRNTGALWSPVVHVDPRGVVWLFYSESVGCRKAALCHRCLDDGGSCNPPPEADICHTNPQLWVPGGDVKVTHSVGGLAKNTWAPARTLLRQSRDGGIPKVIANKVAVLSSGEWLLPFWREQQNALMDETCQRDPDTGHSGCPGNEPQPCMTGAEESAGVLVSHDKGGSWKPHGFLTHLNTTLIEGSLVELNNGTVLMVFRTTMGCLFQSASFDKGQTWGDTRPMAIPNPNSKVHLIRLEPSGDLLLAFNNHRQPGTFRGLKGCKACRSMLHLALSRDGGDNWEKVATVDEEMSTSAVRIHYPTVVQIGRSTVLVAYSRFYLGRKLGLTSPDQGLRVVGLDLSGVLTGESGSGGGGVNSDGGGITATGESVHARL
uniref:Sialidase domain-containing protein n=1 Tax=Mantoniella antarctica TaxID=81844 RepID=A0A7S0SBL6_9CHLO